MPPSPTRVARSRMGAGARRRHPSERRRCIGLPISIAEHAATLDAARCRRNGQARPRAVRNARGGGSDALLCRGRRQSDRAMSTAATKQLCHPAAGAARSRGRHRAVELPDLQRRAESGAGAGRRQLRRAQALGVVFALRDSAGTIGVEAGLPPGVLNVVPGLGETVGRALGLHNDVDMVTFTGLHAVGKRMLQYAGQSNMKVVMAECGGKSPQIVFDDGVDLDAAANRSPASCSPIRARSAASARACWCSARSSRGGGEDCARACGRSSMGDALDPKTTFGPLVSAQAMRARHALHRERGEPMARELVTGGRRALTETGGFFVEPTVFRNVATVARIAQEEIFGPVLVRHSRSTMRPRPFASPTARIYGLAAYVWTANLSHGHADGQGDSLLRLDQCARAPSGEGPGHALPPSRRQSGIGAEAALPAWRAICAASSSGSITPEPRISKVEADLGAHALPMQRPPSDPYVWYVVCCSPSSMCSTTWTGWRLSVLCRSSRQI